MRAQVISMVERASNPVCATTIPRSAAASTSMAALRGPVDAMSFSRDNRSMTDLGSGVALAHDADHVERQEALDNFVEIGQMVIENGDHGAAGGWRPGGPLQEPLLII